MKQFALYDFDLSVDQIAQQPIDPPEMARLLVLPNSGKLVDARVADLVKLLPPGTLLIVNDTKVIAARVHTRKASGGAVELLLLNPLPSKSGRVRYQCWGRANKPIRSGWLQSEKDPALFIEVVKVDGKELAVEFPIASIEELWERLETIGEVPLPPYIQRDTAPTANDKSRYQTVYARLPGAVAAPTAGLHFTKELIGNLQTAGVDIAAVTLHVGVGTFAPLTEAALQLGKLHQEWYQISAAAAGVIRQALDRGRPVVCVGTTTLRALESAFLLNQLQSASEGTTDLFIRPGFLFQVASGLFTNFHLPQSSLLMLVCAFGGTERVLTAYRQAVQWRYRFYSYGDAMLILR